MDSGTTRNAVVIGASSGIGEALALRLAQDGWHLWLAARRNDRLAGLVEQIGPAARAITLDIAEAEETRERLQRLFLEIGGADLVVISAGTGYLNPEIAWLPDRATIDVNVTGFAALAQLATQHFLEQGKGHLVGISSVAKVRGSGDAAAYAASKAFVSKYLDGLRDKVRAHRKTIAVTEICPGFVDTAMMKAEKPFWVATPARAADDIMRAINRRSKHAYVTPRWRLIATLMALLPRPG